MCLSLGATVFGATELFVGDWQESFPVLHRRFSSTSGFYQIDTSKHMHPHSQMGQSEMSSDIARGQNHPQLKASGLGKHQCGSQTGSHWQASILWMNNLLTVSCPGQGSWAEGTGGEGEGVLSNSASLACT